MACHSRGWKVDQGWQNCSGAVCYLLTATLSSANGDEVQAGRDLK